MTKIGREVLPANILIQYLWAILRVNDSKTWDTKKYGGLVPITPNSQEPELDQYDGPHIVYSYGESQSKNEGTVSGTLALVTHDQELRRMNQTTTTIREAFGDDDVSAGRVNNFSSRFGTKGGKTSPYIGIRFTNLNVNLMEQVIPEKIEGGRESNLIMINFECVVNANVDLEIPKEILLAD